MLTSKIFLRKTKRGNMLKIVREHYLRDDIYCGSEACDHCEHESHDKILSAQPASKSTLYPFPHYLVLDTNAVLDHIDVFEEDVLTDVIVLYTVLDEIKHKSSASAEGILVCSAADYVKSLTDHPTLQDKLSHKNYETESTKVAIYPPHLTPSQIHQGIKDGVIHQGTFAASREIYLEGSVNVEG